MGSLVKSTKYSEADSTLIKKQTNWKKERDTEKKTAQEKEARDQCPSWIEKKKVFNKKANRIQTHRTCIRQDPLRYFLAMKGWLSIQKNQLMQSTTLTEFEK